MASPPRRRGSTAGPDETRACIVILGAAVRPDGTASGAMRRRVEGALAAGRALGGDVLYMPTGGRGRHGDAEGEVMSRLLRAAGVEPGNILAETRATDTLSSVEICTGLIAGLSPHPRVLVATDRYHALRCVLLFRLYGIPARPLRIASGRAANGRLRWGYYHLREACAIPWDLAIAGCRRLAGRWSAPPRT